MEIIKTLFDSYSERSLVEKLPLAYAKYNNLPLEYRGEDEDWLGCIPYLVAKIEPTKNKPHAYSFYYIPPDKYEIKSGGIVIIYVNKVDEVNYMFQLENGYSVTIDKNNINFDDLIKGILEVH